MRLDWYLAVIFFWKLLNFFYGDILLFRRVVWDGLVCSNLWNCNAVATTIHSTTINTSKINSLIFETHLCGILWPQKSVCNVEVERHVTVLFLLVNVLESFCFPYSGSWLFPVAVCSVDWYWRLPTLHRMRLLFSRSIVRMRSAVLSILKLVLFKKKTDAFIFRFFKAIWNSIYMYLFVPTRWTRVAR